MWHDAKLKKVSYVPYTSVNLLFVKAAAQNVYITNLNEKEIVIHGGDGIIAARGKLINNIYLLAIPVCIQRPVA